ncbi:MAG: LysE family translocator [Bacteroidales bacterium]
MNPFLEGAIFGLTIAVLLGPALFALVQTSIHRGFGSGVLLAAGIFLSDLTLVVLTFIGANQILSSDSNRLFFGIVSGFILIGYGVVTFRRKVAMNKNGDLIEEKKPGWYTYILKGYFLNIANPFVWLFWMGITVGITSTYGDDTRLAVFFFSGALFTIFVTDLIKAYIAKRIKSLLNPANIRRLNHIVGIILVFFGVVLMVRALMVHLHWI